MEVDIKSVRSKGLGLHPDRAWNLPKHHTEISEKYIHRSIYAPITSTESTEICIYNAITSTASTNHRFVYTKGRYPSRSESKHRLSPEPLLAKGRASSGLLYLTHAIRTPRIQALRAFARPRAPRRAIFPRRSQLPRPRLPRRRRPPPIRRPGRRRVPLRRRRQLLCRPLRLLGSDDSRPRLPTRGRSHPRSRRPRGQLRCIARRRGEPRRVGPALLGSPRRRAMRRS